MSKLVSRRSRLHPSASSDPALAAASDSVKLSFSSSVFQFCRQRYNLLELELIVDDRISAFFSALLLTVPDGAERMTFNRLIRSDQMTWSHHPCPFPFGSNNPHFFEGTYNDSKNSIQESTRYRHVSASTVQNSHKYYLQSYLSIYTESDD